MTKKNETRPKKLTKSEREELIRLREEVEYFKTEQAVKKNRSLEQRTGSCRTQGEKAAVARVLIREGYRLKFVLKAINLPRSTYYYEKKDRC